MSSCWLSTAIALLLAAATSHPLRAESTAPSHPVTNTKSSELAYDYVGQFVRRIELHAQLSQPVRLMTTEIEPSSPASISGFEAVLHSIKEALASFLLGNVQPFVDSLAIYRSMQDREATSLEQEWLPVRAELNALQMRNAEVLASKRAAGKLASLLNLDNRWFWLTGAIALAALVTVSWHDRRHEYRRRLNGSKARAMGVAKLLRVFLLLTVVITLIVFLFGNRLYRYLTDIDGSDGIRSITTIERESQILRNECSKLESQLNSRPAVPLTVADGNSSPAQMVVGALKRSENDLRSAHIAVLKQRDIAKQVELDLNSLADQRILYASHLGEIEGLQTSKSWIRLGTGAALLGLSGFGAILLMRGIRRRKKEIADTCLMCLGVGTLESDGTSGSRSGPTVEMLKCTNVISQEPYEECDFKFHAIYRDMPKLCFPTLGHPRSGKTHWLAMTYRELNQGNFRSHVQFDRVQSEGSESLDRVVDEILNSRMDPMATQTSHFPKPALFNFSDRDRYGKSNLLVSIFDYSGEVTARMTLNDAMRRRALDADGYLFFLDPTERSDEQIKELNAFREDVRVIRKVRTGTAIQAPVALCVSKVDLLVNESYADRSGQGAVGQFYNELREIDPTGQGLTLEIIEARSKLIQQLRDTIWPGWQIERQIAGLFGGRCMFFPLTPVGLTELGERNLRDRQIEPYGILEPLMWLLHMNGYPVLD